MSQQYTWMNKNCATCEYWGGKRNFTNITQQRLEVGSPMDKGRCYCRNSGWFSNMSGMQANHTCPHYERWALLKK